MNDNRPGNARRSASDFSRDRYTARSARQNQRSASKPGASTYQQNRSSAYAAQTRPARSNVYGQSKLSAAGSTINAASYSSLGYKAPKKKRSKLKIIIPVIIAIILGIAVYLFFNPPFVNVTVNGNKITVPSNTTMQDLVKDGHANPKAGNLIAVDGSIAQQGGGNVLEATINDQVTSDPNARVVKDAVITIADGKDKTEEYTEELAALPYQASSVEPTPAAYFYGSIHLYSEGKDGEQVKRTGKVSGKTVTEVTKQAVPAGFTTGHADVGTEKVVALTFDDGPWPTTTNEILQILSDNGAKATFFVIGEQVNENKETVKKIAASGNQIATHSYDHAKGSGQGVNMTYMSKDEQIAEITKGIKVIEDAIGQKISNVMRAPGGNYYGSLPATLSSYVVAEFGWDVDTEDWRRPGADTIKQRILSAKPGDIILCHDGGGDRSQTVEAVRAALPEMIAQGYKFVTVDELLAYGVVPKSGN